MDLRRVGTELDCLEEIQAALARITSRQDPERRLDLVGLRRRLANQTAIVGEVVEAVMTDPAMRRAFREHYSAMRSAAALHQAEWPAIRLGEFDELYLSSALGVRAKNRAFVDWLRATLPKIAEDRRGEGLP